MARRLTPVDRVLGPFDVDPEIHEPPCPSSEAPSVFAANRGGHGVPPEVVQREACTALTYTQTIRKLAVGELAGIAVPCGKS